MTVLSHMYTQSDKIRLGAATRAQDQVPSRPAPPVRRSGVSERRGKVAEATVPIGGTLSPALRRPSVSLLRASRGRVPRSHTGTGERGVVPNTSSCLPHEQGSPPQTPGPLVGRARYPYSARLPPGPPPRCCGPYYPGGQDGRWWGMHMHTTDTPAQQTASVGRPGPTAAPNRFPPPWGEASRRAPCAGC